MNVMLCYGGVFALVCVAIVPGAHARDLDQDEALRLRQEGVIRPLETLLALTLQRYPKAELLEAELEEENDVLIYEVEFLVTDGFIRELDLDARNGRILKDELED